MRVKLSFLLILLLFVPSLIGQNVTSKEVRLSGNGYVTADRKGAKISRDGLTEWTRTGSEIKAYIYFSKPQTVGITLNGLLGEGTSRIEVGLQQPDGRQSKSQKVKLAAGEFKTKLKPFKVTAPGYAAITFRGISKTGAEFGVIRTLTLENDDDAMVFVDDYEDYWARRGPSVHLSFTMPDDRVEWFYNEVTVPEGNDVIGSYYMANGFREGYFGMQSNSAKEKRVLFSVWSPFVTDDPEMIPDSMKIVMLKKGKDVYTGEFGNEGSGGQSFLNYPWKVGSTYRFLTRVTPDGKGNTDYTAWFFAPEEERWRLIASFRRPQTDTYYKGAHSFLENFSPEQGYITRQVYFGNQWFCTVSGKWVSATEATFTYDATANARARIDYQGGYDAQSNRFFLKNCGFFHESTELKSKFYRTTSNEPPQIDFESLP